MCRYPTLYTAQVTLCLNFVVFVVIGGEVCLQFIGNRVHIGMRRLLQHHQHANELVFALQNGF